MHELFILIDLPSNYKVKSELCKVFKCLCYNSYVFRVHVFDKKGRCKAKRKSAVVSSPSKPPRREQGVRQYHRSRESNIEAHFRRGLREIPF